MSHSGQGRGKFKVADVELEFLTGSDKIDEDSALAISIGDAVSWLMLRDKACCCYSSFCFLELESACIPPAPVIHLLVLLLGKLCWSDQSGILEDEPRLREILKFANACGAITTTKKGAIPSSTPQSLKLSTYSKEHNNKQNY
ncbi:hypothetical protein CUMW_280160 [Citrus unshiu]|uniref:Uncharacterized protein n=1 Tax=Citrus unshiu TaxID=55188 RepID=A0A2H5N9R0_CITUN|nr:hypothetical protein CUMW_280160 [Citrus unshiu]